jgi:hypothetical protein
VWRGKRREDRGGKDDMLRKEAATGAHPRTMSMVRGGGGKDCEGDDGW